MKLLVPIACLFLLTALAGCLGDDDVELVDPEGQGAQSEQGLGTVEGRILTISLDPVEGAMVRLVLEDEPSAETTTDEEGEYRLTNVEPGEYRLQVSAACCKESVRAVSVQADETASADLQMEPYSDDDLQQPRVEQREWRGFLACTLRGVVVGLNTCAAVDLVGDNTTGDDFLHTFEIGPGLKTIVGAMEWRAPGASLGDELRIRTEVAGRSNEAPLYALGEGPSPIEFRAEAGYVEAEYDDEELHQYDFDNVEDTLELQYRVFAGGTVNVVYQQQFTVYWDLYYWEPAPEDATALPDL